MSSEHEQITLDVIHKSDKYWSSYVTGMRFGNETEDAYGLTPFKAKLDSGSSYITIPEVYWPWFKEQLAAHTTTGLLDFNQSLKKLRHCSDI